MIPVDDLAPLARGGTAELFTARSAGARVVVKLARDDRDGTAGALAAEAAVLERLGGGLAPRLIGWARVGDRDALVLEHLAMPTLRAAALLPDDRIAVAAAVCAAIAQIHAAGVVHADLTPDNILVGVRGERSSPECGGGQAQDRDARGASDLASPIVRVIDFGVAAPIGAALASLATIGYAAPERLIVGCRADPAVDVYALGVICYELLAGIPPFAGAPGARRVGHAAHRVPRISERVAVPAEIDDAVVRAMAKQPDQRPAGAAALADAMAVALADPTAPRPDRNEIGPHDRTRPAWLIGFRWAVGAVTLRDLAASAGAALAYSDAHRHVAALWRGQSPRDARSHAEQLAAALAEAGACDLDIIEADIQIGAGGVPRGRAIIELGRRGALAPLAQAAPTPAPACIAQPAPDCPDRISRLSVPALAQPALGCPDLIGRLSVPGLAQSALGCQDLVGRLSAPALVVQLAPGHQDLVGRLAAPPLVGRDQPLGMIEAARRTVAAGGSALVTVWAAAGLGKSRLAEAAVHRLAGLRRIQARAPSLEAMIELAASTGRAASTNCDGSEGHAATERRNAIGRAQPLENTGSGYPDPADNSVVSTTRDAETAVGCHDDAAGTGQDNVVGRAPKGGIGSRCRDDVAGTGRVNPVGTSLQGGGLGVGRLDDDPGTARVNLVGTASPCGGTRGCRDEAAGTARHGSPADIDRDEAVDRAALEVMAGRCAVVGSAAEPLAAAPGALRQAAARALARMMMASGRPCAIVVDDAHAADPVVLDALELLTMPATGGVLVVALARPVLAATRPRWGQRAALAQAITLEPLDREAGCHLIRALLPAGAAVPRAALERLVDRAGGVPLHLVELVGAVLRADRARGGPSAATRGALPTDLVELPAEIGVIAWAVADELAGLPPGAAAAAEALAVGAQDVHRARVPRLFEALEAAGVSIELDPGVAVADLVASGVLVEAGAGGPLRFRHDLVRDAIAQRVDGARRGAIHRAMLGLAVAPDERARHAEGAGQRAVAALAWQDAAHAALARHDDLAAETALGRALACSDHPSAALLRQRGAARARLGRHDAAARDFAAARELARATADRGAAIDVLLDEATALDWALHHAAAAARAREAEALAGADEPPLRRARLAMAAARTMWRAGDGERSIEPCRRAIALADDAGADGYPTAIACRLMLGFILGGRGDIDAAAAILDEALAEATARGDLLHIAAARCNRYPVHAARGDAAGLRADLAAFAAAGRELGVAVTEYRGELYQALVALWCDDDARALAHARAARRVEAADPALFPRPRATLVLAELAARRDDAADAAAWCELARRSVRSDAAAAIDAVMLDGIGAWLARRLDLPAATALAHRAIAVAEPEAAFQLLELAARTAARRGDRGTAAAAHRAARTLPPRLPRFIAGAAA